MKMYLRLVSALIQGVEPSDKEKKRNKIFYIVMAIIAGFGIMLPMTFFVGVIIYSMTGALLPFGTPENGAELFLHLIATFSFIFGLNVIFSVFYFSGDIESLLPLPLRPYQIIGAKFTSALISESVMEWLVLAAALIGYTKREKMPFYAWLGVIIGTITMPILPLIYCGIICMIVMYFTRFIKNKDTVNKITGLFTFAVIVGIVYTGSLSGFNTDKLIDALSKPDNALLNVMNCIFPTVPLLIRSMGTGSPLELILYLLINAAAVCIFMLLAQVLYLPSVVGIGQGGAKERHSAAEIISKMKRHSTVITCLKKEFRILVRTPAYFTNCVMINFMCPVFVYLAFVIHGQTNFLESFIYGIKSGNRESVLMLVLGITAVSVLVTAINCIASSAITREGKHFAFIKYIPVPYMTQINVKALISIIFSGSGMILSIVWMGIQLNTGYKFTLFCCLLSLLCVSFATYFGIFMDCINPKLIWDDELNALRGNYNIFFNMAMAIVIEGVLCTGSFLLYKYTPLGVLFIIIIDFVILMLLNAVSYLLCYYKAGRLIEELEG